LLVLLLLLLLLLLQVWPGLAVFPDYMSSAAVKQPCMHRSTHN
jgi:hypothetical protein